MSDASSPITLHGRTIHVGDHLCLDTVRGPLVGQLVGLSARPFGAPLLLLEQTLTETGEQGDPTEQRRTTEVPQSSTYIRSVQLPTQDDALLAASAELTQLLPEFVQLSSGPDGVQATLHAPPHRAVLSYTAGERRTRITGEEQLGLIAQALAGELEARGLIPPAEPYETAVPVEALLDVVARLHAEAEYEVTVTTWTPMMTLVRVRARSEPQARDKVQAMIDQPERDFRRGQRWTSDTPEAPITRITGVREK